MERELTHGIILLAAALHKSQSSPSGGRRNFNKAVAHLQRIPSIYGGIRVLDLVEEARRGLQNPFYQPGFPTL